MKRLLRIPSVVFNNTQLLAILIIVLVSVFFSLRMRFDAPQKLSPQIKQALINTETLDIEITLNFLPEDFHIRYFQNIGNVVGVEGNQIVVLDVVSEDIWKTARTYWVREVDLRD